MEKELNEKLLEAWLETSKVISNRRLTDGLPYNESLVCHILYERAQSEPQKYLTATDLCSETKMLKSLMNATLNSLEKRGLTERIRSTTDRRQIYVRLRKDNLYIYLEEHRKILNIVDEVIYMVGEEKIAEFIPILRSINSSVEKLTEK